MMRELTGGALLLWRPPQPAHRAACCTGHQRLFNLFALHVQRNEQASKLEWVCSMQRHSEGGRQLALDQE